MYISEITKEIIKTGRIINSDNRRLDQAKVKANSLIGHIRIEARERKIIIAPLNNAVVQEDPVVVVVVEGDNAINILRKPTLVLIHKRLNLEAKRNIVFTKNTIKEIAFRLGFMDDSHFSKFFIKMNGLTPLQYRQKEG